MNCREFRRKHLGFVDDTLSGVDLDAMSRHRRLCERCAQLDTRVRRALLLARNLPTIQPSEQFSERLRLRLAHERHLLAARASRGTMTESGWRPFSAGAYAALAAGILAVAGLAATWSMAGREHEAIRFAPVVASLPESEPSALASSAIVASMPAGVPAVWPAVFVAQQAQWHLASDAIGH